MVEIPIPECSVRKLTQNAKVQVEQKFFAKSFRRFEMCVQFSNYCNAILTFSHSKKIQGVAIIFKHFYKKFFFLRALQAPLKSNIKFQGFSSTSRSSTNHDPPIQRTAIVNWYQSILMQHQIHLSRWTTLPIQTTAEQNRWSSQST